MTGTIVPYAGARWQRGYGLGSIFRGLFRTVLPLVKSAGKQLLKTGLKTGVGLASDAIRGKDMSQALRHRVAGALNEVSGELVQTGNKRKLPRVAAHHSNIKRRRLADHAGREPQKKDIFSS